MLAALTTKKLLALIIFTCSGIINNLWCWIQLCTHQLTSCYFSKLDVPKYVEQHFTVTRDSTPGFGEPRGAGEPGHFSTPNPGVFRPPNPGVSGWKMCGWWVENTTVSVLQTLNLKLRCKDKPAISCQLVIDWLHYCISCIIYLLPEYCGITHHSDHC